MRWLVALLLAGCGPRGPSGPAWPNAEIRLPDGGESLAPHPGARAIAAAAVEEDDVEAAKPPPAEIKLTPVIEPKVDPSKPAPAPDEPVQLEDIVIEVEE